MIHSASSFGDGRSGLKMRKIFRNWYKSKTQWLNGALVFIGLVQTNIEELRALIPPSHFGAVLVTIGMVGWYLRTITSKSLDEK